MAETNPVKFLLNQSTEAEESAVVESNAFSLTKVLAAGAIIVGPIATGFLEHLKGLETRHWVLLAVALLGFLAIIAAADVIARSIAAAAQTRADTHIASIAGMNPFKQPLSAHRIKPGEDAAINVLASASGGYFLVKEDDSVKWLKESEVRIP